MGSAGEHRCGHLAEEARSCGGSAVSVISWDSGGRKKRKEEGEEKRKEANTVYISDISESKARS